MQLQFLGLSCDAVIIFAHTGLLPVEESALLRSIIAKLYQLG